MNWKWKWEVDERTIVELKSSMFGKETVLVNNREVSSKRNFKFSSTHEFKLPQYREGKISISTIGFRPDATLRVDDRLFLPDHLGDTPACPQCQATNKRNDGFCLECGAALPMAEKVEREHKVKEAITTIRVLAGMFLAFGVLLFFLQKGNFDASLEKLAGLNPSDIYPQEFNGKTYKVGELQNLLQIEKYGILALNIFLSLIMVGLSFWAKKSPLGALIVATSVYVAIIVLNAAIDPTTIAQGIVMKMIIIGMLIKGIKSALELKPAHAG